MWRVLVAKRAFLKLLLPQSLHAVDMVTARLARSIPPYISRYIGTEFIFYLFSPLFLVLFLRHPKTAHFVCCVAIGIGCALRALLMHFHSYPPAQMSFFQASQYTAAINDYHENFYTKPYTRFGPYLIGLMLGQRLYTSPKPFPCIYVRRLLIVTCLVLLAWSIAGVYPNHFNNPSTFVYVYGLFYGAAHHSTFAVAIALAIALLYNEQTNSRCLTILTCKPIVLMANVSYGAYLMQMVPVVWFLTWSTFPQHFHGVFKHTIVALVVGSMSYFVGFFYVTVPVEMPTIALQRLFEDNGRQIGPRKRSRSFEHFRGRKTC